MLNKCLRLWLSGLATGLMLNASVTVADNTDKELLNILATFQGQIESLMMVPVVTTFYLESGTVKGKYKYVDEGAWDHGTLTDIRVDRDSCGGGSGQAQSGTAQQNQSSAQVAIQEEDDEESESTLMGAGGKAKKKKKKNTAMARSEHDLCIRAMWHDSYGDGSVEFRFNPTRDYFSGLYWSPGYEKAVWNGNNF